MMKQMSAKKALNSGKQVYMSKLDVYGYWKPWKPVDPMKAQAKSYVTCENGMCPYRFAIAD